MKEFFFNANGVRLNYVRGPNNGPALLLLPAQGTSWKTYTPVFKGLAKNFEIFALSIHGHGKSDRAPNRYNFKSIGNDLVCFINQVVRRPAWVAGNSSGGLMALWLGANAPQWVKGLILEDTPMFSAEWPRIQREFVYQVLRHTAGYLGKKEGPDYTGMLSGISRPMPNGKTKRIPLWMARFLSWLIRNRESMVAKFLLAVFPRRIKQFVGELPDFDPAFAQAWVDGTFYRGLVHEEALRNIHVPLLIIHANWYRTSLGLIGAMDDKDAEKALRLAPHAQYIRIDAPHGVHAQKPKTFAGLVNQFVNKA